MEGPWDFFATDEPLSIKKFDRMLTHLAATKPAFRKKMVEACAVLHDGRVTATEAELLRAVAARRRRC